MLAFVLCLMMTILYHLRYALYVQFLLLCSCVRALLCSGNVFVCSSVNHQIADILVRLVPYQIGTMCGICRRNCNRFVIYCCSLKRLRRTARLVLAGWFQRMSSQPGVFIIQAFDALTIKSQCVIAWPEKGRAV